jgi:hypothetical protein
MPNSFKLEVSLHNIHEMSHLGKDEHSMTKSFQLGQDTVNQFEFARRSNDPLMIADIIVVFEKQIRMVAAFPQLHHEIGQSCFADLA